jgi:hypothetical protein
LRRTFGLIDGGLSTTMHQEFKDPEKYNIQEPLADEAVLKDQLALYKLSFKCLEKDRKSLTETIFFLNVDKQNSSAAFEPEAK